MPHSARVRAKAALDLAGYYSMIENLDTNVGRLRQALSELGVDRETYLVFLSDHGDCLGSHGQWRKSSPWEESIRIPFIVSVLGGEVRMKTGRTDAVLNHVDIAPTTLGPGGIDAPAWMVGHDYSGSLLKSPGAGSGAEVHPHGKQKAEPDSAYLQRIPREFHPHTVNRPWRAVVSRDGWKYVCMPGHEWLLIELQDDPYEMAKLAHDTVFQGQNERCRRLLCQWIESTGDTFPMPAPDGD